MPGLQENFVGVGPMCDANCTIKFTKYAVNIYSPTGTKFIADWRETKLELVSGACL